MRELRVQIRPSLSDTLLPAPPFEKWNETKENLAANARDVKLNAEMHVHYDDDVMSKLNGAKPHSAEGGLNTFYTRLRAYSVLTMRKTETVAEGAIKFHRRTVGPDGR